MAAASPPPDPDAPGPAPRGVWLALGLLWVLALAGRWTGLGHLLPHAPEPDAYVVQQALLMEARDGPPSDPVDATVWRKYPHLLARLLTLAPLDAGALPPLTAGTLDEHLDAAARPWVLGRALSGLLASLAVPLTFLLARRFVGPWTALLAAAFVATSLLHLSLSQMARPHAAVATFTLAATWLAVEWERRPRLSVAVAAALAAGLAVATLHNGLAALAPLGVAWLFALRRAGRESVVAAALVLGGAALAVWLAYPFLGETPPTPPDGALDADVVVSGHDVRFDRFRGGGFAVVGRALLEVDPVLAALAALGLGWLAVACGSSTPSRRRSALVVAGFGLPYLVAIGLYDLTFERFALPLWPLLAVLAAHGVARTARALGARRSAALALALVALAPPTAFAVQRLRLALAPDTYELAAVQLAAELDPADGVLLLTTSSLLPLPMIEVAGRDEPWSGLSAMPWRDHLLAHPPVPGADVLRFQKAPGPAEVMRGRGRARDGTVPPATLRAMVAQLTDAGGAWILHTDKARGPRRGVQAQALEGRAERLLAITPWRDGDESGAEIGYQGASAVERVLESERLGPCLHLWRLP